MSERVATSLFVAFVATFILCTVIALFFESYYKIDREQVCLEWEHSGVYVFSNTRCVEWSD